MHGSGRADFLARSNPLLACMLDASHLRSRETHLEHPVCQRDAGGAPGIGHDSDLPRNA